VVLAELLEVWYAKDSCKAGTMPPKGEDSAIACTPYRQLTMKKVSVFYMHIVRNALGINSAALDPHITVRNPPTG